MVKIAGLATIKVDGKSYSTDGAFDITIQNESKEVVVATDGTPLTKVTPMASTISGTLFNTSDADIDVITGMEDGEVMVELGNGKVAVLKNASPTGEFTVSAQDGTISCEWKGRGEWA